MYYTAGMPVEKAVARPPAQGKPKSKSTHGQFDPDDLSRRLHLVLAEQKAQAETRRRWRGEGVSSSRNAKAEAKKLRDKTTKSADKNSGESTTNLFTELRRVKAAKADGKHGVSKASLVPQARATEVAGEYHHVPKEAAKQFTLTTTSEPMQNRLVHRLSKRALRFHKDGIKTDRTPLGDTSLAPSEQDRALHQELEQREKIFNRNQFQNTKMLDEIAEVEEERRRQEEQRRHRYTFVGELSKLLPEDSKSYRKARRSSTGDLPERVERNRRSFMGERGMDTVIEDTTPPNEPNRYEVREYRADWSQSDETQQRTKPRLTPLLRKADSIWTLRGRLGSRGAQDSKNELPQEPVKSPKSGFFARLRR